MDRIEILNVRSDEQLRKDFSLKDDDAGYVQVGSEKWFLTHLYREQAENYANFEVRDDDVWIIGLPRSGTTLTEEMVWLILNDVDLEKVKSINPYRRITFFDGNMVMSDATINEALASPQVHEDVKRTLNAIKSPLEFLKQSSERRVIKTHLAFELLPPEVLTSGSKVIYLARNPKDVIVSYYHFSARPAAVRSYVGDFEKFFHYYKNNQVVYTPHWSHIEQAWAERTGESFKFLFYEDLVSDLRKHIVELAQFLGKSLTETQIDTLVEVLQFDAFKQYRAGNDSVSRIRNDNYDMVRKGEIGNWKEYFKGDLLDEADEWIRENLEKTSLTEYASAFCRS